MKNIWLYIPIIVMIISCHHNKHDACPGSSTRTSADFKIEQTVTNFEQTDYYIECDTCIEGWLRFTLKDQSADSVFWKIGGDTSLFVNEKEVSLLFKDSLNSLPVTCIVKKKPDTKCFPDDDGVDTITKVIVIKGEYNRIYLGTFNGYNEDNPSHYFTIRLALKDTTGPAQCNVCSGCIDYFNVHNLPEGSEDPRVCLLPDCDGSYKSFKITTNTYSIGDVDGLGYIDDNNHNKVIISYSFLPSGSNTRISKKFIGYRQ